MAEKVVIFEADIKIDEAIKAQQDLTAEIEKQKKKLDELKQSNTDNSEAVIKQTALIKVLVKEQKANEAQLQSVIKSNIKATGSIDQLSAELSVVTKQWNALSEEERENTEEGRALTQQKTELTKKLSELRQATGDSRMEVGKYKDTTVSLKLELRENIKTLAQMKAAGEDNTEAYQKLLKTTGELQDTIADTREEVKRYASDTQTLDMAIGVFNGIGSAAQIAEGASALLGDENENLTKSIQKMVAIQSIMNGLQEIQNALQKESAFMMGLNTVKTKAMAAAQAIYTTAVGTSTGAMKVFRTALLATGIGAIIASVALLVANWDKLTASVSVGTTAIDGAKIADDELRESHNKHIATLRDLQIEYDLLTGKITEQEAEMKKLANEYSDRIVEITNSTAKNVSESITWWDKLKATVTSGGNSFVAAQKIALDAGKKIAEGVANEVVNLNEEISAKQRNLNAKEQAALAKEQAELAKEIDKIAEGSKKILLDSLSDIDGFIEGIDKELESFSNDAITSVKETNDKVNDYLSKSREIQLSEDERARALKLEGLKADYDNELALMENNELGKLDAQRIRLEAQKQEELRIAEETGASVQLINDKYRQMDLELERAKTDAKLALAAGFMGNIATLFGEGTAIGKAAAITETIINTYKGAQAAYASLSSIPIVGPALGAVAAAAQIKVGFDNVKKIKAAGKGGGGGGAGATTASAPIANAVNPSVSMGAVSGAVGTSTGQMVTNAVDSSAKTQIAVVVDDVTAKQNQKTNANKLATL